jgi:diguanylate cyclase (GGDEF)-like protein
MLLETLTWGLITARGIIPDSLSIIVANGLLAAAYALRLAAILEFQQRKAPHSQYWAPVALTLVLVGILPDEMRARLVWIGLIFIFQMVLIARALFSDQENRAGHAWKLLLAGIIMTILVLGLRASFALFGNIEFAQPQNTLALHPIQFITYIAAMAIALLGSFGFVLMVKGQTDREVMLLAMTDSLTKKPNRRALMGFAEHALARRNGSPLALLMIDMDHFKRINDTHGHLIGDEVLQKAAALLAGRLRKHDLLSRYGGEEFCVIAPDTDAQGAQSLAESLRSAIASTPIVTDCGALLITVSIGIPCCPPNVARALKDVLTEADTALYDAKKAGRNKVACFNQLKLK